MHTINFKIVDIFNEYIKAPADSILCELSDLLIKCLYGISLM